MSYNNKKIQIIEGYIKEMLPYLHYSNFSEDLKIDGQLKFGDINSLQSSKLDNFIHFNIQNNNSLVLDFKDSSIKDIYKGFDIINKTVLGA